MAWRSLTLLILSVRRYEAHRCGAGLDIGLYPTPGGGTIDALEAPPALPHKGGGSKDPLPPCGGGLGWGVTFLNCSGTSGPRPLYSRVDVGIVSPLPFSWSRK